MGGEHVLPRGQSLEAALLSTFPQHPGHDRQEGRPQCPALVADLAAAHRVAAGACEARARALEGGGGPSSAAAAAVGLVHEGNSSRQQWQDDFATRADERARSPLIAPAMN